MARGHGTCRTTRQEMGQGEPSAMARRGPHRLQVAYRMSTLDVRIRVGVTATPSPVSPGWPALNLPNWSQGPLAVTGV